MQRPAPRVLISTLVVAAMTAVAVPGTAEAFCGAYVSGGEAELFNNATHVALMRHEQTTVLSMQNNYQGPPEDFAMIVPVPQVLDRENVETLDDEVFDGIDTLTAPRLVEYQQGDPCKKFDVVTNPPRVWGGGPVEIEAQFAKGEYEFKVLSSDDSSALEQWLTERGYNIPDGAAPYLEPYIQQGSKFIVAKVDADKVEFNGDGQAVLSPLRFHYESEEFKLPVRLGLINSRGQQDLIVNVLAKNQRYDVANYPTATIPTNLEVDREVKAYFPAFYRKLFERTLAENRENGRNPVVTEYAWSAKNCDPCPVGEGLEDDTIETLGGDVLSDRYDAVRGSGYKPDWVVTRLHTRYGKETLGEDLVFERAEPITGGRGRPTGEGLDQGAEPSESNNFQGRYIVKHPWEGEVDCEEPDPNRWGDVEDDEDDQIETSPGETNRAAGGDEREIVLDEVVEGDIASFDDQNASSDDENASSDNQKPKSSSGKDQ